MAWLSPRPVLIPDILSWNQEFLRDKPAVIIDDDIISWSQFGSGTARFANSLIDADLAIVILEPGNHFE